MIEAYNLVRKYDDIVAVDDVSFKIAKGEIVGLLGHNGAGKTTVMKMLTGFLEPSGGRIVVDGKNIEDSRLEIQSRLGYLPENCPVYPEMTVIEYLSYVAELRGIQGARHSTVLREALEKTRLTDRATQLIGTLSKGYRQRVGVAQAILHQPDILILDEPTSGLDPGQINEIRSLIVDLGKEATVILSTHILQEVHAVCSRVLIMVRGKLGLDSTLSALQQANRLRLTTDSHSAELESLLADFPGVSKVDRIVPDGGAPAASGRSEYLLTLSSSDENLPAEVAKAVIGRGSKLFALHPETRDLESVFREVNAGM